MDLVLSEIGCLLSIKLEWETTICKHATNPTHPQTEDVTEDVT